MKDRRGIYVRLPDIAEDKATDAMVRLARERTSDILAAWCARRDTVGLMAPVEVLVQSVYFQGAADMAVASMRGYVSMPPRRAVVHDWETT